MKKLICGVMAGVATFTLVYLLGAFMAWELNPAHWTPEGRGVIGLMGMVLGAIVGVMTAGELDER